MKTKVFCIVMFGLYIAGCVYALMRQQGEKSLKQFFGSLTGLAAYLIYCYPLAAYIKQNHYKDAIVAGSILAIVVLVTQPKKDQG